MSEQHAGYAILPERGVVAVVGADRLTFLQGLISNDTLKLGADQALHNLFLTPQGKYLHDFTLVPAGEDSDALLLDPEMDRRADLLRRLKMYKLRSKIELQDRAGEMAVVAFFGGDVLERLGLPDRAGAARPLGGGVIFTDARLPELGARAFLPREGLEHLLEGLALTRRSAEDYRQMRIAAGVPTGAAELEPEKALPLENRFDALNAISWDKGCYIGQELTARTRYRALIKKKLFPIILDDHTVEPGSIITDGERELGEIRAVSGTHALAMLRLEAVELATAEDRPIWAGDIRLTIARPDWMAVPA